MFSKTAFLVPRSVAVVAQQERGMATLKQISLRLKSVKNIQKITQSMKMVSAAKYARAERDLKPVRPYGQATAAFYEKVEPEAPKDKPKTLIIAMSSDRGLCGGIHSSVCKAIKNEIAESSSPSDIAVVCIGDKSRAQIQRLYNDNILLQVNEVGRKTATFEDASHVASTIINSGYDFGKGKIIFNKFKSVVAYNTLEMPIYTSDAITNSEKLGVYDSLDADVIQSYMEYSLASQLFYCFKEGACSEQSARMTAMDSASKNAGEMIDKLTLTFNRTRQSVITGELIEIISGAAAL